MSSKREREKRREERIAVEQQAGGGERRQRLLQLTAGAVFLAVVAVVVLIVATSGGGGGDASNVKEEAEVNRLLAGIPQSEMVLGDPKAPVELVEFGDLQCSSCKYYSENVLPSIIESRVKKGEVKIDFRNFTIIDEDSIPAGAAALAAGKQGRGWSYLELFYRNQGEEHSGYVTDEFLEAVAKGAGVKDLAKWNRERKQLVPAVEKTTAEAHGFGFSGTPSFAVEGPQSKELELLGTPESTAALEAAIEGAS